MARSSSIPAAATAFTLVLVAAVLVAAIAGSPAPPGGSPRAAVRKALPLLQASAHTWYQKRDCFSCHHQGLGILATTLANQRGFAVDDGLLRGQLERPTAGAARDRFIIGDVSINEQIGQSFRAISLAAVNRRLDALSDLRVQMLMGKQHVTGHWSSYSHRPPLEDSEVTATALTIRALRLHGRPERQPEIASRVRRAAAWLAGRRPTSTEEQAMVLLGFAWASAPRKDVDRARTALLAAQRPDGGWAQIPNRRSDAYATGQALVALNQAGGLAATNPAYARGVAYLLRTQQPDGSWLVETRRTMFPGLPYFETGFPHEEHQFISYAASAWAVMALTLAGDGSPSDAIVRMPPLEAGVPPAMSDPFPQDPLTPLMYAALWGTAGDLAARLKEGADVNAATKFGLTALMCAAHDPAKVQLLVERGANVNAQAKSGHSALILAAAYDGAADSVRLLLDRRADPNAVATEAIFPGPALLKAALRGDTKVMAMLFDRGVKRDNPANGLAVLGAVAQWDLETTRFLLDRGLPADARLKIPDVPFDPTVLMMAAADVQPVLVRLLIERGADVNARAFGGRTPLMFAAGAIERGDEGIKEIVQLLLKAGADPAVRSESNDTALALAERHGNKSAAALLAQTNQNP